MKRVLFIFIVFISSFCFANDRTDFQGSWLCIAEESIGYKWDEKSSDWKFTKFFLEKYIVKVFEDRECNLYDTDWWNKNSICAYVHNFEEDPPYYGGIPFVFKQGTPDVKDTGHNDSSIFSEENGFKMSLSGNFIEYKNIPGDTSDTGWTYEREGLKNYKDTMTVSVGKCSRI